MFNQMKRRGIVLEEILDKVQNGLRSVLSNPVPSLMVSRVRGWLADVEKKLLDYEGAYQEHIQHLPEGHSGAPLQEMNYLVLRLESRTSNLHAALDREEMKVSLDTQKEDTTTVVTADNRSQGRSRVFLEQTKLPIFSGKVEEWPISLSSGRS